MFLRKCRNSKTGRTQLSIVESYRRQNGRPTQKVIKNIGYLDEVEKTMDDPIAYYTAEAERMTREKNEARNQLSITLNWHEQLQNGENNRKNFGYVAISDIYHELALNDYFSKYQRSTDVKFNINDIFKSLLFSRVIYPSSKHKSFIEYRNMLFEKNDFSESDIFCCVNHIAKEYEHIQQWINQGVTKLYGRDTSLGFYYLAKHLYEIDNEKDITKRGVGKENQQLPVVQVGLLRDKNYIPIHIDIYTGKTNGCKTLIPIVDKVGTDFGFNRTVVVNHDIISDENVCKVHESGNGYIFSYPVRKAYIDLKEYILDTEGYKEWLPDKEKKNDPLIIESEITGQDCCKYKSRIEKVFFKDENGVLHEYNQKQIIFFSPVYAQRAKREREAIFAEAPIEKNKCDSSGKNGVGEYIATYTGENNNNNLKTYTIDRNKIAEDEKYDGYYAIMSSETELTDSEIISRYKELWHIEESFSIAKGDLKTVCTENHIKAHFIICFISLVILRILEIKLGERYKASAIINSLRKCECTRVYENIFQFQYIDEILEALQIKLEIDFATKNRTLKSIQEQFTKAKSSSPLKIRRVFKRRTKAEMEADKKNSRKSTPITNGETLEELHVN